jgi:hypothetical protein
MPAPKRTGMIATNVRLPRVLHKSLKREAKRQGIPFNQLLIDKLEKYKMNTIKEAVDLLEEVIDAAVQRGLERFQRSFAQGIMPEMQPAQPEQSQGDGGGLQPAQPEQSQGDGGGLQPAQPEQSQGDGGFAAPGDRLAENMSFGNEESRRPRRHLFETR